MVKIKKQIKRENSKKNMVILITIAVMAVIPYFMAVFVDEGLITGLVKYGAAVYTAVVEILLFTYAVRVVNGNRLIFSVHNGRIKIKEGLYGFSYTIPVERLMYVDIIQKKNTDFEILLIINHGKRNKYFREFNIETVENNPDYSEAFQYLQDKHGIVDFYAAPVRYAGAKKYFLLYAIYKNCYKAVFAQTALNYVKRFMEEYNMT